MTTKRKPKFVLRLAVLLFLLLSPPAGAEFYKYVGPDGRLYFVDDPGQIPEEIREQAEVYAETVTPPAPGAEVGDPAAETPVVIVGNQILVPVTLGYKDRRVEVRLLLDTGASIVTLHRKVAERLDLEHTAEALAQVADGTIIRSKVATLDFVQVGPVRKTDLYAGIIDFAGVGDYQGLLGMNFLRELAYHIDFRNQVIRWHKK